jgi:hypothetical protein
MFTDDEYKLQLQLIEREFDKTIELLRALLRQNLGPTKKPQVADLLSIARLAGRTARRYASSEGGS